MLVTPVMLDRTLVSLDGNLVILVMLGSRGQDSGDAGDPGEGFWRGVWILGTWGQDDGVCVF